MTVAVTYTRDPRTPWPRMTEINRTLRRFVHFGDDKSAFYCDDEDTIATYEFQVTREEFDQLKLFAMGFNSMTVEESI